MLTCIQVLRSLKRSWLKEPAERPATDEQGGEGEGGAPRNDGGRASPIFKAEDPPPQLLHPTETRAAPESRSGRYWARLTMGLDGGGLTLAPTAPPSSPRAESNGVKYVSENDLSLVLQAAATTQKHVYNDYR